MKLGVDPGISGALVLLENGQPVEWMSMPTLRTGAATRVSAAALAAWMRKFPIEHAFVEHVNSMPGQGVVSMFTFGHACGVVQGVLGGLQIPYTLVPPPTWKKKAGLLGTDKDAARSRAIQIWPQWRDLDSKGKGQALADAALIALTGTVTQEEA